MIKGVTEKEEQIIKEILKPYPYDFYYYGSRVKGDFTKGSDLDILIKSSAAIPVSIMEEISIKFNKSLIPYIVNLYDYHKITNKFYILIKNSLVKI